MAASGQMLSRSAGLPRCAAILADSGGALSSMKSAGGVSGALTHALYHVMIGAADAAFPLTLNKQ